MGVDTDVWSDGGVYIRLPLDRVRLEPADEDADMFIAARGGIIFSGSLLICDLASSAARLRTKTAESCSASV